MKERLAVVMGVTSCGKSTVGAALARGLEGTYIEGDDLHPHSNIAKMRAGIPLNDEDRWPWLETLGRAMAATDGPVVASCSALKRAYRERIAETAGEPVMFVFLDGAKDLIATRMAARKNHFMPAGLLDSQFEALERPADDERHVTVSIDQAEADVVAEALAKLGAERAS